MNLDDLLLILQHERGNFYVDKNKCIRHKTKRTPLDAPCCPLAVAFGGPNIAAHRIAEDNGMSKDMALHIMYAADNSARFPNYREIRDRLLTLCEEQS